MLSPPVQWHQWGRRAHETQAEIFSSDHALAQHPPICMNIQKLYSYDKNYLKSDIIVELTILDFEVTNRSASSCMPWRKSQAYQALPRFSNIGKKVWREWSIISFAQGKGFWYLWDLPIVVVPYYRDPGWHLSIKHEINLQKTF